MSLLPKNEPTEKDITPKVFFIWGQSMHGKTYLARQFPNPLIVNTDGNGKKTTTPHVDVFDFETFAKVINEIEEGKHDFETIIIDLVDDIKTMMDVFICDKAGVENLADIGFGKGFSAAKSTWKRLMIRLTQMPYTIIFISHIVQRSDENDRDKMIELPSLEQQYLNMTKGRTDVMIKCQKVGKTYLQLCNEKRDSYKKEDFKNKDVLKAVENVKSLFEDNKPVIQTMSKIKSTPLIKKKGEVKEEVVEKAPIEKQEEVVITVEKPTVKKTPVKKSLLIKKEEEK